MSKGSCKEIEAGACIHMLLPKHTFATVQHALSILGMSYLFPPPSSLLSLHYLPPPPTQEYQIIGFSATGPELT